MAIRLPEILIHRPDTPVPKTKGNLRWYGNPFVRIGLGLATLTGGAALAHQMFTGADKGPSAPPVDNGSATDTFKPPTEGPGGEQPGVVTITPDSFPGITPDTTSKLPEVSGPSGTGPDGSPDPKPKPTESKIAFDCGFLSPDACPTGEYIEWRVPIGPQSTETKPLRGMGYTLKAGEKVKISENFVVAASKYPESDTVYHGTLISGITRDGKRKVGYIGDLIPSEGVGNVGIPLDAETDVGTIGDSNIPVFNGEPYNLVVIFPTEEDLRTADPKKTERLPKVINNQTIGAIPSKGNTHFDVTPPKG